MGNHQKNQRQQEQHAACWRQLLKHRPEKFLYHVEAAAARGKVIRRLGFNVAGVEAIAGSCLSLELRPELADLKSVRHPPPETMQLHPESRGLAGLCAGWRSGSHGGQQNYRGFTLPLRRRSILNCSGLPRFFTLCSSVSPVVKDLRCSLAAPLSRIISAAPPPAPPTSSQSAPAALA